MSVYDYLATYIRYVLYYIWDMNYDTAFNNDYIERYVCKYEIYDLIPQL